jgi:hypothetical protein
VCFLASPDPESFSEALLAALTDQSRREAVVAAAKTHYEKEYSKQAYVDKMRRLLELLG